MNANKATRRFSILHICYRSKRLCVIRAGM